MRQRFFQTDIGAAPSLRGGRPLLISVHTMSTARDYYEILGVAARRGRRDDQSRPSASWR